ncbi:MAG: class I SAM-dependent methyltransferase [Deltaproteobacteria bacterium]|nr:class I SAM-dependent methyltransferase [Deltaproteobacteria bacterium]
MGIIIDNHTFNLYESWRKGPKGKAMDQFIEDTFPRLVQPLHRERILDIGCGSGNNLLFFNKLGLDITGLDASPYMINIARKRLGNSCLLKKGQAEDLPFDDNEFDVAVLINTLEFLDDPIKALREAGRVAKRKVFICVLNNISWYCLCSKIEGIFHETFIRSLRLYNLWELKSYIRSIYGTSPIAWCSEKLVPRSISRLSGFIPGWSINSLPIGSFLGLSVRIEYRFKTENIPLKVRLKSTGHSIAGGVTNRGTISNEKDTFHERSLSI